MRPTEALRARKASGLPLGRPKGPGKSKLDQFRPEIEALLANGSTQAFIAWRYTTTPANLSNWIRKRRNLMITGPCGVGKTWLACALGQKACRDDKTVIYQRIPRLFAELELAHGDGRFPRLFRQLVKADLLILDDRGPDRLTAPQRRDLMEIVEDRYGNGSTIITSQLSVDTWHDVIIKGLSVIQRTRCGMALVSTSSICQGEQVALLWPRVLQHSHMNFAYRPFKWANSAANNAQCHRNVTSSSKKFATRVNCPMISETRPHYRPCGLVRTRRRDCDWGGMRWR